MIKYLIAAGTVWCWAKLILPWARAASVHEELLEIEREILVSADVRYGESLFHLATVTEAGAGSVADEVRRRR